jgi:hypothetical protein
MNRWAPNSFVGAARGGLGGGGGGGGFVPKGFTSLAPGPAPAPMMSRPAPAPMMPHPSPSPSPRPAFHRGGGFGFGWPWWGWGSYWPWWGYGYGGDVCASVRNAYQAWQQALSTGSSLAPTLKSALDGVMATSSCPARSAYWAWQQAAQAGVAPLAQTLQQTFEGILYQGTNSYTPFASGPYYGYPAPFGFPYGGLPVGSLQVIGGRL